MAKLSEQLEEFARSVESAPEWNMSMNTDLYALARKASDYGFYAVPMPKPTDAFDSVFKMRPPGWMIAMQEVQRSPDRVRRATCSLMLRDSDGNLKTEVYSMILLPTLLMGLVVAVARAWAYVLRGANQ